MIWISALLVFGTVGVILTNLSAQDGELHFGFQQIIHARIPWILIGLVWAGCALGIASWLRKRARYKVALLALELPLVALVSWYFLSYSFLPPHDLAVRVGDPFPAYALVDQDGKLRQWDPSTARKPVLYIFYRGDW